MKRVLAIILALALVLSCTAALATDYPLTAEKETFKLIIRVRPLHGNPDEMELFKRMEELTNVHIEWEQIQQAEYDEKKSLLLGANKNLPEGFFGKYSLDSSDPSATSAVSSVRSATRIRWLRTPITSSWAKTASWSSCRSPKDTRKAANICMSTSSPRA